MSVDKERLLFIAVNPGDPFCCYLGITIHRALSPGSTRVTSPPPPLSDERVRYLGAPFRAGLFLHCEIVGINYPSVSHNPLWLGLVK